MISNKDTKFLKNLINKVGKTKTQKVNHYPLLEKGFTTEDIMRGVEVLLSRKITMSEITKKFEYNFSNFVGSKYSLMVNSGSSANLLAAFALVNPKKKRRLKPGDKFIIPAICWSTSLWPLIQCGLKPKFIDVNIDNYCLDENLLKKDKQTKAIMNIHILGNSPNMDKLTAFAKSNNMFLIEDTCEALGSKFKSKHLGTFGDMGILSFNGNKTITTGGGGVILVKNKSEAKFLKRLSTHAKVKTKYDHMHDQVGFNYRMSNLSAAVGCAQLENINKIIKAKRKNFTDYYKIFKKYKDINIIKEPPKSKINYWLITAVFENVSLRNKFIEALNKKGFEFRYTWKPLHLLKIFKNCPSDNMDNSNRFYKHAVNLPSSPILNIKKS